jgi:hypothetical protein
MNALGIATSQIKKELNKVEELASPSLITAFVWAETPQGDEYWAKLNVRMVSAENNITGDTLERLFRQYCHSPYCRYITECPQEHRRCAERLGLDTAIAWKAIGKVANHKTTALCILLDVVQMHWKKYQRLEWLLNLAIAYTRG